MSNVITNGTGTAAKVDGIIQGGKTGTATGEGGATTHGWFAGYFELDNKLYTLVIVAPNINGVDENGTELAGGNTAAPIYREKNLGIKLICNLQAIFLENIILYNKHY